MAPPKKATVFRNQIFNRCEEITPGWRSCKVPKIDDKKTRKALNKAIKKAISKGAKAGISDLCNHSNPAERKLIQQISKKYPDKFRESIPEDYPLVQYHENLTIQEIAEKINALGITSSTQLKKEHCGLYSHLCKKKKLPDVYDQLGWGKNVNYVKMNDHELAEIAIQISQTNTFNNITQLEYKFSSALVRELRKTKRQNVMQQLYTAMGWAEYNNWQEMNVTQILDIIKKHQIFSLSDLHDQFSGAYKYLKKQELLTLFSEKLKWGESFSIEGKICHSKPEVIVYSLMELSQIPFSYHDSLPFYGKKNGIMESDFVLYNISGHKQIIGEIWACRITDEPTGIFKDYPKIRKHKTEQYARKQLTLFEIEGIAMYKPVDGFTPGFEGFCRYINDRFKTINIDIDISAQTLHKLRKHLSKVI